MCHGSGNANNLRGTRPPGKGVYYDEFSDHAETSNMASNGWLALCAVGPTAARPDNAHAPMFYIDTTIGKVIVFDGFVWRDPMNGSVA